MGTHTKSIQPQVSEIINVIIRSEFRTKKIFDIKAKTTVKAHCEK